jgi:thiosulfate reductase cytochrome b subunit
VASLCYDRRTGMADSAHFPALGAQSVAQTRQPATTSHRHSATVRITHWLHALTFVGLVVSGVAILLAHPRLYWGETGSVETQSLVDLPLPFLLIGQNGWGRYLHFLSAWICVLTGLVYLISGVLRRHFQREMLPSAADLKWNSIARVISGHLRRNAAEDDSAYNSLQRISYSAVVFTLFPLVIWTGLAMSPAMTSVFPVLVTIWGGHQSARTTHFVISCLLVLFLLVHVAMVCVSGFRNRVGAMISGGTSMVTRGGERHE